MVRYFITISLVFWVVQLHAAPKRIISLSSALTETVYALGYGSSIVAVDVTSVSPAQATKLPRVSKNRVVSAEGLISFKPNVILAPEGDLSRAIIQQLRASGIRVISIRQQFSSKGATEFIQNVANAIQEPEAGKKLASQTQAALNRIQEMVQKDSKGKSPKVLFIYARGAGTMSVAGKGSNLDAMISLAGGKNAIQEFSDFKPYTTEALVKANPDIILLFDFGMSTLGGKDAILRMPGVRITNAGKNKRIIEMESTLMVNFSARLPEAIEKLHRKFKLEML